MIDMNDTIFTKIIKGEMPCYKLYEDDKTIAFLDIDPARYGHSLVVSKTQIDQYIDLPDDDYEALWRTVKKVATRLRSVLAKQRVGILVHGTDVPHVHVQLIPFDKDENTHRDESSPKLDESEFVELANKLRF